MHTNIYTCCPNLAKREIAWFRQLGVIQSAHRQPRIPSSDHGHNSNFESTPMAEESHCSFSLVTHHYQPLLGRSSPSTFVHHTSSWTTVIKDDQTLLLLDREQQYQPCFHNHALPGPQFLTSDPQYHEVVASWRVNCWRPCSLRSSGRSSCCLGGSWGRLRSGSA